MTWLLTGGAGYMARMLRAALHYFNVVGGAWAGGSGPVHLRHSNRPARRA